MSNLSSIKCFSMLACVAAGALVLGGAAQAADANLDNVSVKVRVADLDLRGEAGAKAALGRITMAARGVCGDQPEPRLLGEDAAWRSCVRVAVSQAVAALGSPMVAALHDGTPARAVAMVSNDR